MENMLLLGVAGHARAAVVVDGGGKHLAAARQHIRQLFDVASARAGPPPPLKLAQHVLRQVARRLPAQQRQRR